VIYSNKLDDNELIAIAKKEKRVLLTRDFELYQQATAKNVEAFYLEGQTREQKLAELARRFNIDLDVDLTRSRCPRCNTRVRRIPKEEAMDKVERNTLVHYDEFWTCTKCGQIYWQGIIRTLEKVKEAVERN
jgi:uncharacterized protein with PIN domain